MRLSTNTLYDVSTQSILRQQSKVSQIGEKLASNREIVKPSDDPRAAAQALVVSQADSANDQFKANRSAARNHLGVEETALDSTVDALQAAKSSLVQAGNGTLSDADRASIATTLEGVRDQLLDAANSRDGTGRYIFAGFASDKPAFAVPEDGDGAGVAYQGDHGVRELAVDGSRKIATNDIGEDVFKSQDKDGSGDNIINAIGQAIGALRQGTATEIDSANLSDTLTSTQQQIDDSLNNVSDVLAQVGARGRTLDSLDTVGDNRSLNYKTTLSDLQDLDVVKAISDYSLAQVALQFSQKTFIDTQKLSIFNL